MGDLTLSAVGSLGIMVDDSLLSLPANMQPTCAPDGLALTSNTKIGAIYSFKKAGDNIPFHAHSDGNSHYIVVLRGTIAYEVKANDGTVTKTSLPQGSVIIVPDNVSHQLTAVEGQAACFNIRCVGFDTKLVAENILTLKQQVDAVSASFTSLLSVAEAVK